MSSSENFADRLMDATERLGHPLCVGLDPHLGLIPALFRRGSMAPSDPQTVDAVQGFLSAVIDRLAGKVAVVKPQIAFFEALGWRGLEALDGLVRQARRQGILVLLDAKRGDIGSTAKAYAAAYLGLEAPMPCDAITLNPYLGRDSLEPFVQRAEATGSGLFILVKTSNPGSGDYQDRAMQDGETLYAGVAASLAEIADRLRGASGWSSLGVVVGATYPGESETVRRLLPQSLFLVPGYGAQGGSADAAVRGFVRGPGGNLGGGIINSSRGVLFPADAAEADAKGWEDAFDRGLQETLEELRRAVA